MYQTSVYPHDVIGPILVEVNYDLSLQQMVEKCSFPKGYNLTYIKHGSAMIGVQKLELKLVCFNQPLHKKVAGEMLDLAGYAHAGYPELCAIAEQYAPLQLRYPITALGIMAWAQKDEPYSGCPPCLGYSPARGRYFDSCRNIRRFGANYRFLVLEKAKEFKIASAAAELVSAQKKARSAYLAVEAAQKKLSTLLE